MTKTTNIYIRLKPEIKEEAELILSQLGIPMSNAVNMFLKQIIMQRGIPFDLKLPIKRPMELANLTENELDNELEKGYNDMNNGNIQEIDDTFSNILREYKL